MAKNTSLEKSSRDIAKLESWLVKRSSSRSEVNKFVGPSGAKPRIRAKNIFLKQLFHERALDMRWARSAELAITNLISNKREWNNCFIKFY